MEIGKHTEIRRMENGFADSFESLRLYLHMLNTTRNKTGRNINTIKQKSRFLAEIEIEIQ